MLKLAGIWYFNQSVSVSRGKILYKELEEDITYIQKLGMISSLHTTYGVSGLVIDKSQNHLVTAKFLSKALLQLSKFYPQPFGNE